MVDDKWLNEYIDAWILHPLAGTPEGARALKAFIDFLSPDVRYEDVPTNAVFTGHEGIKDMCRAAYAWAPDLDHTILTRQTNGSMYAFETEWTGTNSKAMGGLPATGRRFEIRGISVGHVSNDDLVDEHRDYWDLSSFIRQVGA